MLSGFYPKTGYLFFDTFEKRRPLLPHRRRPLLVLLLQFRARFFRIPARLHLELVRKPQARVQHLQSFLYELKQPIKTTFQQFHQVPVGIFGGEAFSSETAAATPAWCR